MPYTCCTYALTGVLLLHDNAAACSCIIAGQKDLFRIGLYAGTGHTKWITSVAWEPAHKALPSRRFCTGSKDVSIKVLPCPFLHRSHVGQCCQYVVLPAALPQMSGFCFPVVLILSA